MYTFRITLSIQFIPIENEKCIINSHDSKPRNSFNCTNKFSANETKYIHAKYVPDRFTKSDNFYWKKIAANLIRNCQEQQINFTHITKAGGRHSNHAKIPDRYALEIGNTNSYHAADRTGRSARFIFKLRARSSLRNIFNRDFISFTARQDLQRDDRVRSWTRVFPQMHINPPPPFALDVLGINQPQLIECYFSDQISNRLMSLCSFTFDISLRGAAHQFPGW